MRIYKWKRGLSSKFFELNPILEDGVIAYETDTKCFKCGDGNTNYNDLPHMNAKYVYEAAIELGFSGTEEEYYSGTIVGVTKNSWGEF